MEIRLSNNEKNILAGVSKEGYYIEVNGKNISEISLKDFTSLNELMMKLARIDHST